MTTLLSLVVGLIGAPIAYVVQFYLDTNDMWVDWIIDLIPPWGIIIILVAAVLLGLALIPTVLQINNKLAILHARMVQRALTR